MSKNLMQLNKPRFSCQEAKWGLEHIFAGVFNEFCTPKAAFEHGMNTRRQLSKNYKVFICHTDPETITVVWKTEVIENSHIPEGVRLPLGLLVTLDGDGFKLAAAVLFLDTEKTRLLIDSLLDIPCDVGAFL